MINDHNFFTRITKPRFPVRKTYSKQEITFYLEVFASLRVTLKK